MPVGLFRTLTALAAVAALAVPAVLAVTPAAAQTDVTARPDEAPPRHVTGTLPDGATWIADVPADWNGTQLLFAHVFGPTNAQNAPNPAVRNRLLAEGYALAGSSYDPEGPMWALNSAERDQFATLEAFGDAVSRPERTISLGQSMGGLVNAQIARDSRGRVDGALGFCGLVAGATDLGNYQLDAEYALARLLLPGEDVKLVDFADEAEAAATADRLTAAVEAAQATPQGRARIALTSAYLNLRADLATLTRDADVAADPAAVRAAKRSSSAGQGLEVPLLNVHTTADQLVPAEQENIFADRVRASGDGARLRQAYVARPGHCAFATAEYVAAVHAVDARIGSGRRGGRARPAALQRAALELDLDGAAYVPYRPAELVVGREKGGGHR
jgi:pimeloyl-ACP methyl ester carboxylesterase